VGYTTGRPGGSVNWARQQGLLSGGFGRRESPLHWVLGYPPQNLGLNRRSYSLSWSFSPLVFILYPSVRYIHHSPFIAIFIGLLPAVCPFSPLHSVSVPPGLPCFTSPHQLVLVYPFSIKLRFISPPSSQL